MAETETEIAYTVTREAWYHRPETKAGDWIDEIMISKIGKGEPDEGCD